MVEALRFVQPERASALTHDLFVHVQPGVSNAQLAGFLLEAWVSCHDREAWIFDNLEAISGQPDALDLLVRIIRAPGNKRLILCARPPFPLLNSRLIPPNEHLRLGVDDLAFSPIEMEHMFDGLVDESTFENVVALTQGWPVAVLLARQLARDGRLEPVLRDTGDVGFQDMSEYLLREVIDALSASQREVLVALIATQGGGNDAVLRATGGRATPEALLSLSQSLPLVRLRSNGSFSVHPIIEGVMSAISAHAINTYRLTAAESYELDGIFAEAARLYVLANRDASAADCLERIVGSYLEANSFAGLGDAMESLPPSLLVYYPRLWAMLVWVRRAVTAPYELLAEGLAIREGLRPALQSLEAKQIAAVLLTLATLLGDHNLAGELLADYEIAEDSRAPGDIALLIAQSFRNMLRGRTRGMMERYVRLMPLVHNDLLCAYYLLRVEVVAATMCGRFDEAKTAQLRAFAQASSVGSAGAIAGLAHHQAVVAWLAGDDAAVDASFDEIRRTSGAVRSRNYSPIADAWASGSVEGLHALVPRMRAFSLLLMAGKAPTKARRSELLAAAAEAATAADDLWSGLLIIVAQAMGDAHERVPLLEQALAIAKEIGQAPLVASVESLLTGGNGAPTLAAVANRFLLPPSRIQPPATIQVSALAQMVYRGAETIPLSNRVRSFVVTLAILKRVRRDDLLELLWDNDLQAESNALKMLISRARHQLGDPSLIEVADGFYSLRSDVVVDVDRIERLLGSLSRYDPLTGTQRAELRGAYERFTKSNRRETGIPSIDAAIDTLRHRVIERLAQDALDHSEIDFAVSLADQMRRDDPSDESAYELMIRAYIRSGNSASALREYRKYSDHLINDLGVEPSFTFEELLPTI
jgi:DNA-binding SARP family transcriptional activator